ncbi:MAG: hypothetical protein NTY51_01625 [Deltaproteobacteria bacterium]|nr:hypothetical protein [Deltaproteobacteria bacterium]
MNPVENSAETFVKNASIFVFIAGVFTLGLGGFLLLSAIAYAMVTENLALGLACGVLLFSPYVVGIAWFFGLSFILARDSVTVDTEEPASALSKN